MTLSPPLFAAYDLIAIINLPERVERRRWMENQLERVGLAGDPRVNFFPAFKMPGPGPFRRVGSHGAFLSHLAVLNIAAHARKSVLILQDDCEFLPALWTYHGFAGSIFYGSHSADAEEIIGAHFMGFSAHAAIEAVVYLDALYRGDMMPDPLAVSQPNYDPRYLPPIDGSLVWFRRHNSGFKTEFALLSRQRQFTSDCTPKWFDKAPVLGPIVNAWRVWNGGRARG
jgi:glycosyl transferase, family 25